MLLHFKKSYQILGTWHHIAKILLLIIYHLQISLTELTLLHIPCKIYHLLRSLWESERLVSLVFFWSNW